jgi:DNA polymerase-3 subunit beta
MNITVSQSDLNAALRTVARAIGSGKTHPILTGVLLNATDDGQLELTAYDLDLGITTTIAAAVNTPGATVVPHRLLADIVSRLSGALTMAVDGARLALAAAGGSYSLSVAAADNFPALPAVKAAAGASVDISADLAAVLPACSTDAAKQLLTGVNISPNGLAATDGHRLAMRALQAELPDCSMTIPARSLQLVRQPCSIAADNAHAAIQLADGTLIISRILDGTYPNVAALVPGTFKASCTADREALLSAIERVAIIADQHNGIIKLTIASKALTISAEAETNTGNESVAITGKLPDLALNAHYLADGLRAMDGDTITISANEATTPVVLIGLPGQTYLIMPVQVRS